MDDRQILEAITHTRPNTDYHGHKDSWKHYCKKALTLMKICQVNLVQHPAVWQQKIILLNLLELRLQAWDAAIQFEDAFTTHEVDPATLEKSTAVILGLGYYNLGHFSKSCRWYKIAASLYHDVKSQEMYLKYAARSHNYFVAQLFPCMVANDDMFKHANDDMFEHDHLHIRESDICTGVMHYMEKASLDGVADECYRQALHYIDSNRVNVMHFPLVWEQKICLHLTIDDVAEAFSAAKDFEETLFNGEIPKNFDSFHTAAALGEGYYGNHEYRKAWPWLKKAMELCDYDVETKEQYKKLADEVYSHILSEILYEFEEKNLFEEADNANFLDRIMPPEPELEDDVVGDDVVEDDGVGTDVHVPPPVLKCHFEVVLVENISNGVFLGVMKNSCSSLDKTFIQPTKHQSLEKLQYLRDGDKINPYLVRVDMVVKSPSLNSNLLVCQRVVPIDHYFQRKLKEFKDSKLSDPKEWWRLIAPDVGRIFRDVIQGCRILYPRGSYFGDLYNSIYVTKYGQGRILPSLQPSADAKDDINGLINKMKSIIGYPFPEAQVDLKSYSLPDDIRHFLTFVRGEHVLNSQDVLRALSSPIQIEM